MPSSDWGSYCLFASRWVLPKHFRLPRAAAWRPYFAGQAPDMFVIKAANPSCRSRAPQRFYLSIKHIVIFLSKKMKICVGNYFLEKIPTILFDLETKFNFVAVMKKKFIFTAVLFVLAIGAFAQKPRTFCNPLNIDYQPYEKRARTAADPVIVPFENKYYLFCSLYAGGVSGYRISDNLLDWKLVKFPDHILEKVLNKRGEGYAPAVFAKDGYIYWMRLDSKVVIRSKNPSDANSWEVFSENGHLSFDPCFFLDDDGKVYNYFGALESNVAELKPDDFSVVGGTNRQITPKTKGVEPLNAC